MNRFQMERQKTLQEEKTMDLSSRKQSSLVARSSVLSAIASRTSSASTSASALEEIDTIVDGFVVETDERQTAELLVLASRSDAEVKDMFQRGLKYSKRILEGSHPVSCVLLCSWL